MRLRLPPGSTSPELNASGDFIMPYTGPNDPNLPSNVKRLSAGLRRQWVNIFNSSFSRCMRGDTRVEAPSAEKCESFAFQNANGVVFDMKFQTHGKYSIILVAV